MSNVVVLDFNNVLSALLDLPVVVAAFVLVVDLANNAVTVVLALTIRDVPPTVFEDSVGDALVHIETEGCTCVKVLAAALSIKLTPRHGQTQSCVVCLPTCFVEPGPARSYI